MATPATSIKKSVVIPAGETFVLPNGASISSVTYDGAVSLISDCTFPAPSALACYEFAWEEDITRSPDAASHQAGTQVIGTLEVGGAKWTGSLGTNISDPDMKNYMNTFLPGLFTVTHYNRVLDSSKWNVNLCFKVPSALKDQTRIQMYNDRINDSGQPVPTSWIYARDPAGDCSCA